MPKELLFSVTIDDCVVQTFTAGGKGGQNQNRVQSGVRVIHPPSGARGEARDSRDQLRNKRAAFRRMAQTTEFQAWHRAEISRRMGTPSLEQEVERAMRPENLRVEAYSNGRWVVMDERTEEGR